MAFFECELPREVSFDATGGDRFSTIVNRGFSGGIQTNRNWERSLAYFMLDFNGKTESYFASLKKFFLNVGGKADGFRFYWALDNSFTGQNLGIGDGSRTQFQLVKTYTTGARTYTRTIFKPITSLVTDFLGHALTDTIKIYLNGVLQSHSAGYHTAGAYTLDETTGIITFASAPGVGVAITADGQFHIPVRFDIDDMMNAQIMESNVLGNAAIINWSQMSLEELRLVSSISSINVNITVDGRSTPWLSSVNPTKPLGDAGAIAPAVIAVSGGQSIIVTYVSGGAIFALFQPPTTDLIGNPNAVSTGNSGGVFFAAHYVPSSALRLVGLVGAFVDVNGTVLSTFDASIAGPYTAPDGTVAAQFGTNDIFWVDNGGAYVINVQVF